ncbi:MAG TPA: glycosyltransferase, partial [Candidatus Eisenbacteria bacterium]|nr:glycosyltransferase [Candidatus Eisenbacteria bacterium]
MSLGQTGPRRGALPRLARALLDRIRAKPIDLKQRLVYRFELREPIPSVASPLPLRFEIEPDPAEAAREAASDGAGELLFRALAGGEVVYRMRIARRREELLRLLRGCDVSPRPIFFYDCLTEPQGPREERLPGGAGPRPRLCARPRPSRRLHPGRAGQRAFDSRHRARRIPTRGRHRARRVIRDSDRSVREARALARGLDGARGAGTIVSRALSPSRRVLMVAFHYPPEGGSSGVLRTLKFSRYLLRYGWQPHVLTLTASSYPVRDEKLLAQIPPEVVVHRTRAIDSGRHLAIRGRYLSSLAIPDRFIGWLPFAVPRGIDVVRRHGIDAIYSTSPLATAHLIALRIHRATRVPWVADFRDPWIEEGIHPRPGSMRERIERRLERAVVRGADRLVMTTSRLRDEILARHPDLGTEKARVIY